MGKKRQGANSGSNKGASHGGPNWTPYLIGLGIIGIIAAFMSNPSTTGAEGGAENQQALRPQKSIPELEAEIRRLHAGLVGVAGRGSSGLFKKIQDMADKAQGYLARAASAETDEERRKILEEGLLSKQDWLATLTGHQTTLQKEQDAEETEMQAAIPDGTNVAPLSASNFSNFIAKSRYAMVEFYAPWCPHCKKFAPEYDECAKSFKGRAGFAAVDGTAESQLMRVYNVQGYPTLKWFVHGRSFDYEGPRTAAKLSSWVEERLKPAYVEVDSSSDIDAAVEAASGSSSAKLCVGIGDKNSELFRAFHAAAEHFRGNLVFVWAPPASAEQEAIKVYLGTQDVQVCGSSGEDDAMAAALAATEDGDKPPCRSADDVIAWLEDRLSVDPDI